MKSIIQCVLILTLLTGRTLFASTGLIDLQGQPVDTVKNLSVIAIWPPNTEGIDPSIPEKAKPCNKRFFDIHNPNITVYKPEKPNGTAIVLCAGGGYAYIATGVEGGPTAEKLIAAGITVFVLKYRLPAEPGRYHVDPATLSDALRAIQLVRYHAGRFGIDPGKVGIMGFSAGGHLASMAGALYSQYHFGFDSIAAVNSRPDFMVLIYAVIPESVRVNEETPPAFLVHAKDDSSVAVGKSITMYDLLTSHGVKSELKLYETGGHGFGPGRENTDSMQWPDAFLDWLRNANFLSENREP